LDCFLSLAVKPNAIHDIVIHASGEVNLLEDEAVTVGGSNHSHATQDLQDAIAAGDYPEWTLYIQVCH
jgi:catalase